MTIIDLVASNPSILVIGAIILGLLVGSFLNVVIYRLPVMMEREWTAECRLLLNISSEDQNSASEDHNEVFNLAVPGSRCPGCNAEIKPWQNIPVISYLLLKGQCARCKTPISIRYPIIEMATGLLSGIVAWQFGFTPQTLFALLLTWSLISLTMIDADHKLLPDQITLPLLWLGLLVNSYSMFIPLHDAVWGAIGGYMSLWTVYQLFKLATGKEGMGFGDFKLLAALGAWMGWQALPMIILMSSLVGAVLGIIILSVNRQDRNTTLPFGPYLAVAGWITLVWGEHVSRMYFQIFALS